LAYLSACTTIPNTLALAWASQYANELSSDTEDPSGLNPSQDKALNSSSLSLRETHHRPWILVIEDNPTDIFMVQEAIAEQELGVGVNILQDGKAAIDLIEAIENCDNELDGPSLILLDLNLPMVTGLEILARLRKSERWATVPVVVMTSSAARRDRENTAALGADAYFVKPSGYSDFMEIGDLIRKFL
jgi:CheY-like chemotaxis protein